MTSSLPDPLTLLVSTPRPGTAVVGLDGELDYETSHEAVETVRRLLVSHPDVRRLELHCGRLTLCDSTGLSALLMIRRLAEAAGAYLVLTERQAPLRRFLEVTGTVEYLSGAERTEQEESSPSSDSRPG
ncbi:STAS domain-containing protein [Streptomyces sp. NPDC006923]|uniref:STAS domain-containing protein n=1 Tax=Streptomyces sp. NPDC006923 TaxID=3155355 RepID=UPI0033C17FBB